MVPAGLCTWCLDALTRGPALQSTLNVFFDYADDYDHGYGSNYNHYYGRGYYGDSYGNFHHSGGSASAAAAASGGSASASAAASG